MDASNLMKPLLSSGQIKCMGSTTYQEYRGIFDKDRALSRKIQKIDVIEPDIEDIQDIEALDLNEEIIFVTLTKRLEAHLNWQQNISMIGLCLTRP